MRADALAADLCDSLDPVGFGERALGLRLYEWQRRALASTAPRSAFCVTRQGSKSSTAALIALHAMLAEPETLVVVLAHRLPAAGELARKTKAAHRRLGEPVPAISDSALSFELANHSRLVCVPGNDAGARSWSAPKVLIIDEAARVPRDAIEAALPTQAVVQRPRCLVMSTPRGRVEPDGTPNWFAHEFEHGDGWERECVTAEQIPSITPEWLESERQRLGPLAFQAEYLCSFDVGDDDSALDAQALRAALSSAVAPLAMPGSVARPLGPRPIRAQAEAVA